MISFVCLRNESSRSPVEPFGSGYHIYEAFTVSEAVWLCTKHHIGVVIVAHDFKDPERVELRKRFVVFNLKPNTTLQELRWHLTPDVPAVAS
jgi:ABC-type nitrate/sulfonate/bicarbonate transport system ATPase subunit